MTTFETLILIALCLFAFSYMAHWFGLFNEHNTWLDKVLVLLIAGTIGVLSFPMVFAEDIWNKLNKEEKQ